MTPPLCNKPFLFVFSFRSELDLSAQIVRFQFTSFDENFFVMNLQKNVDSLIRNSDVFFDTQRKSGVFRFSIFTTTIVTCEKLHHITRR